MLTVSLLAAAFVVTPAMKQLLDDIKIAMKLAQVDVKEAAAVCGVHPSKLYRQLNAEVGSSDLFTLLPRFAELPKVLEALWWIHQMRTGRVVAVAPAEFPVCRCRKDGAA